VIRGRPARLPLTLQLDRRGTFLFYNLDSPVKKFPCENVCESTGIGEIWT
jgi:hypothetical protein